MSMSSKTSPFNFGIVTLVKSSLLGSLKDILARPDDTSSRNLAFRALNYG